MLDVNDVILMIIDVQGKLARLMYQQEKLIDSLVRLIRGALVLEIPVIWAEQVPEKLGSTVEDIRRLLEGITPIAKDSFSCCGNKQILSKLENLKRRQVLVAGIEAHVCVYQTVQDLLHLNYEPYIIADAVSSRTEENKIIGVEKMRELGAKLTSVEMLLFELVKVAKGDQFRLISRIVK